MRTSLITHATPAARAKIRKIPNKDITSRQRSEIMFALIDARGVALNMRQLGQATGIEIPTVCRRLDELVRAGRVRLAYKAECPITSYPKVKFFKLEK